MSIISRCPYCGKRISYIHSMLLRKQGEFYCYKCQCTSNIVIHRGLYALASAVCVSSFLIMVLFSMFGDHSDLRGILWVLIPFAVFYIATPFFVRLEPFNDKIYHQKRLPKALTALQPKNKKSPKPIKLEVTNDFSANFMRAKKNVSQKIAQSEQNSPPSDNLPKDIANTQILFELNDKDD